MNKNLHKFLANKLLNKFLLYSNNLITIFIFINN